MSAPDEAPAGIDRPAFYALAHGSWRDYVTLLHLPYTAWHLSYVVLGAAIAPAVDGTVLAGTVTAFFLAVGLAAHALDELRGRPLGTGISAAVLVALAGAGLAGATALGALASVRLSPWLGAFTAAGAFLVITYNLELWRGRFHSGVWFALGWGAFPVLTAYWAQAGSLALGPVLLAGGTATLTMAQHALSAQVRHVRRELSAVEGVARSREGGTQALDRSSLLAAPEAALRLLSLAVPLLAAGLLASRL